MALDQLPPALTAYINRAGIALEYDDFFAETVLFRFDTDLLDKLLPAPCRLLDVGCGTGRHVVHFAGRGFDVTGVDLSTHMLLTAATKCHQHSVQAELLQHDIRDLSMLDANSFDAAICMFSTLGMIRGRTNRLKVLQGAYRALRPGGQFVFHVHNRWHNLFSAAGRAWLLRTYLSGWLNGEIGDKQMQQYRGIPNMFLHVFTLREIKRMVASAGMNIEAIVHLNELRDGPLSPCCCRGLRANGFIVVCRKKAG